MNAYLATWLGEAAALAGTPSLNDIEGYSTMTDILIVGGGLSGARLIQELTREEMKPRPGRQIRILAIDKRGEFGGGIAYGEAVPLEFLLSVRPDTL